MHYFFSDKTSEFEIPPGFIAQSRSSDLKAVLVCLQVCEI